MTMKPNMELNSMMFFEAALEEQRSNLLSDMAAAVSECREAADQAAQLSEDGEAGLLRMTEIRKRQTTAGSSPAMSATAVWPTPSSCWPSASILPPPDGSVARTM